MALATFSDLQTSVANYLGRSDLTSQIPDFISLAELRLARDIRTRRMLKTVTANMTVGDPTVGLPSDFLSIRDVFIQGLPRTVVSYVSPSIFSSNSAAVRKPPRGRAVPYERPAYTNVVELVQPSNYKNQHLRRGE